MHGCNSIYSKIFCKACVKVLTVSYENMPTDIARGYTEMYRVKIIFFWWETMK